MRTLTFALVLGAFSSSPVRAEPAAQARGTGHQQAAPEIQYAKNLPYQGCPVAFISRLHKDANERDFLEYVFYGRSATLTEQCWSGMVARGGDPQALEDMLQSHPMTAVPGMPKNFVSACFNDPKVMKRSGMENVGPYEKLRVIGEFYLSMNRIRSAWMNLSENLVNASSVAGLTPFVPEASCGKATGGLLAAECEQIARDTKGCGPEPKNLPLLASKTKELMTDFPGKVSRLVAQLKQGGVNMSPKEAGEKILGVIPYGDEPEVRAVIERMKVNGDKAVSEADLRQAFRAATMRLQKEAKDKLENLEKISSCIGGGDPRCFSDEWHDQTAKMFRFDRTPDVRTRMRELPEFDPSEFLGGLKDLSTSQGDYKKKLQLTQFVNAAQCMQEVRTDLDAARNTGRDFLSNFALMGLPALGRIGVEGIEAGMKIVPRITPSLTIKPAWGSFPVAIRTTSGKLGVGWRKLDWVAKPIESKGLQNLATWMNKHAQKFKISGKAADLVLRAQRPVDLFWMGFGGVYAAEACGPVIANSFERLYQAKLKGCGRDFIGEQMQGMEYVNCAVGLGFGALPGVGVLAKGVEKLRMWGKHVPAPAGMFAQASHEASAIKLPPKGNIDDEAYAALTRAISATNPYEILGVPFGTADRKALKSAYRQTARKLHPDAHQEQKEAFHQAFLELEKAAEKLGIK